MTTPPAPQLEYATPASPRNPHRKKAVSHCRALGIACVLLGLLIGFASAALVAAVPAGGLNNAGLIMLAIGVGYGGIFIISGVIYLIAGFKIRVPNPAWEKIVCITATVHLVCIIAWVGLLVWSVARTGSVNVVPFLVAIALAYWVGQSVQLVKAARTN
jgi:hypothetical protein